MIPTMKFVIFLLVLASGIQNPGADVTDSELDDILDENVEEMTVKRKKMKKPQKKN